MIRIFQSDRPFSESESSEIERKLVDFTSEWSSHGNLLAARGKLLHNRFVVLTVDERQHGASGCSIDKSMRFVQNLGAEFGVDFFNRYLFSYQDTNGIVHTINKETFSGLYIMGAINDETPVFDTLISDESQLETLFVKKLGQSWLRKMV